LGANRDCRPVPANCEEREIERESNLAPLTRRWDAGEINSYRLENAKGRAKRLADPHVPAILVRVTAMTPELEHRLSALADKLGVSIEHLWGVLVRQASIDGVYSLLIAAAAGAIMVGIVAIYWLLAWRRPSGDSLWTFQNRLFGGVVAGMLVLAFGTIFFGSMYNALTDFGNPEYFAIRHLPFSP
jgi:hypothetical protein